MEAVKLPDDAALVAAARTGSPQAFAPIVERYKDAVFGVAFARLRRFHEAEDTAQDAFVRAYGSIDRLKDPAKLGPAALDRPALRPGRDWAKKRNVGFGRYKRASHTGADAVGSSRRQRASAIGTGSHRASA